MSATVCTCPDPWCEIHARCGACGSAVIVMKDNPAFCPACRTDVMPARACGTVLAVVAADTEGIAPLTEIIRVEMSKGAYQMLPDELPYESAARRVAAAVAAYLAGEPS